MTVSEILLLSQSFREAEQRQDRRTALICAILANVHRDSSKRPQPFTIEDFMPGFQKEGSSDDDEIRRAVRLRVNGSPDAPEEHDGRFGVPARWIAALKATTKRDIV